jgi:hypothetical protein
MGAALISHPTERTVRSAIAMAKKWFSPRRQNCIMPARGEAEPCRTFTARRARSQQDRRSKPHFLGQVPLQQND